METIGLNQAITGDNLLVSTNSWLGRAIQDFQKCKWNHAGKIVIIDDVVYVCEADKRGICLTPLTNYTNNQSRYTLLIQKPKEPFKIDELDKMVDFMLPLCGHVGYEYVNLLIYQPIKYLTGIWLGAKKPAKADKRYICGEWVARVDNEIRGWFEGEWEKIAPVDLFNSYHYTNYLLK
jgi:hypothetical protein